MRRRSGCHLHLRGSFDEILLLVVYKALFEGIGNFNVLFQIILDCVLRKVAVYAADSAAVYD